MSILSPVTATSSRHRTDAVGAVVKGEQHPGLDTRGLQVALVAVVLVGFIPGQKVVRPSLRGLLMAAGSRLAIGGFMVSIDQTSDHDSGLVPLIMNRAVNSGITWTVVGVLALAALRGVPPADRAPWKLPLGATPTGHADLEHVAAAAPAVARARPMGVSPGVLLALACGVVDAIANTMLLIALRLGDLAVISPCSSAMYPAGTIILAAAVLRERIAAGAMGRPWTRSRRGRDVRAGLIRARAPARLRRSGAAPRIRSVRSPTPAGHHHGAAPNPRGLWLRSSQLPLSHRELAAAGVCD